MMGTTSCCYGMISCSEDIEQNQNPTVRLDRILDVRHKLKSGKYNVAERLDVVVDKLLEDVLVQ